MSALMQSIIVQLNTEHAASLARIEASAGRFDEAETLAATLRSHGIKAACTGFANPRTVNAYVQALHNDGAALRQALADADLQIAYIERREEFADVHLRGLECTISIDASAIKAITSTPEPAHG